MLGTLDDDQALSLVEAMVEANGERVMALINEAAARGIEWEALLVEMLGLLHRIAMVQLSPAALGNDMAAIELRMRELARTIPPTDIQLYYQTLLIGRKELPYAPDRRMGVEMTLLRALAFHPRMPLPEPEVPRQSFAPVAPTAVIMPTRAAATAISAAAGTDCTAPETTSRCWRRASSCSACRSNQSKKVNRQPLPRAAGE
ncbi:hypothetical protein ECZU25_10990 [Escherichia coli]|nr:hypothetical protein ECZU25_10990 [Escherichia coli]